MFKQVGIIVYYHYVIVIYVQIHLCNSEMIMTTLKKRKSLHFKNLPSQNIALVEVNLQWSV